MPGLTLRRRVNESIVVGETVITVVTINSSDVQLNVVAPANMSIRRRGRRGDDSRDDERHAQEH